MTLQAAIHLSSSAVCTVIGSFENSGEKSRLKIIAVGMAHTDAFSQGQIVYREHLLPAIHKSLQEAMDMSNVKIINPVVSFAMPSMVSDNAMQRIMVASSDAKISAADLLRAHQLMDDEVLAQDRRLLQRCQQIIILDSGDQVCDAVGLRSREIRVFCHQMSIPTSSYQQMQDLFANQDVEFGTTMFDGVAGAEYALNANEKRQGVLFVDIGATMTKVCVYNDNSLLFTDCFAIGGDTVDLDIAKECGIALQDADAFKRQEGTLNKQKYSPSAHVTYKKNTKSEKTMLRRELNQVIEARYHEIFSGILSRIEQVGLSASIDAGIVLAGGGAQMDGLVQFLRTRFGMPARLVTTNPRIELDLVQLSDDNIKLFKKHLQDNTLHSAIGALLYANSEQFGRDQQSWLVQESEPAWYDTLWSRVQDWLRWIKKYV